MRRDSKPYIRALLVLSWLSHDDLLCKMNVICDSSLVSVQLSTSAKLPVMVYFHAGGYARVTGSSVWEGPQYLLDKDVVLVTLNYRLGALGEKQ